MRRAPILLLTALALGAPTPLQGQSVDVGRGPVPVAVPAAYDPTTPTPLVISLHGYSGNAERHDAYFGVSALVDDYGFLLVTPEGTREATGDRNRFWNGSDACCDLQGAGVDDVTYLAALIDAVSAEWSVDPRRIYLVGHSNGGFMSYRMAYEHPERIAAIASLAGAAQGGQRPAPAAPVNILQIHGTADDVIEYGGGEIGEARYPGARATVAQWARHNGCDPEPKARETRDLDASLPGHETGVISYVVGCAPGGRVTLWTIAAGAHGPALSASFAAQVIEWLYAHPKATGRPPSGPGSAG
jgi:polyhydroxybutyrate depolymerase